MPTKNRPSPLVDAELVPLTVIWMDIHLKQHAGCVVDWERRARDQRAWDAQQQDLRNRPMHLPASGVNLPIVSVP